jgi:hypothetical protein
VQPHAAGRISEAEMAMKRKVLRGIILLAIESGGLEKIASIYTYTDRARGTGKVVREQ